MSGEVGVSRVPPEGEEFGKNAETGRVHIMPWTPRDEAPAIFSFDLGDAYTKMLCGTRLWPAVYVAGDDFADSDLCARCVRALGDQSDRAFHVDNRSAR